MTYDRLETYIATSADVPLLQEVAFYSETSNGSSFMVWFDDDESPQTVDHTQFVSTQSCAKSILLKEMWSSSEQIDACYGAMKQLVWY